MKVDLRTPPSHTVAEVVTFAQKCEAAGFHGCGFNDSQLYFRDTFVVASHVLANTERLVVHPALTSLGTRHAARWRLPMRNHFTVLKTQRGC